MQERHCLAEGVRVPCEVAEDGGSPTLRITPSGLDRVTTQGEHTVEVRASWYCHACYPPTCGVSLPASLASRLDAGGLCCCVELPL
jgi:hypothetical protein